MGGRNGNQRWEGPTYTEPRPERKAVIFYKAALHLDNIILHIARLSSLSTRLFILCRYHHLQTSTQSQASLLPLSCMRQSISNCLLRPFSIPLSVSLFRSSCRAPSHSSSYHNSYGPGPGPAPSPRLLPALYIFSTISMALLGTDEPLLLSSALLLLVHSVVSGTRVVACTAFTHALLSPPLVLTAPRTPPVDTLSALTLLRCDSPKLSPLPLVSHARS